MILNLIIKNSVSFNFQTFFFINLYIQITLIKFFNYFFYELLKKNDKYIITYYFF